MDQANDDLPTRFQARIKHRDKKRKTKMIVDGQGLKRIDAALRYKKLWYSKEESTNHEDVE